MIQYINLAGAVAALILAALSLQDKNYKDAATHALIYLLFISFFLKF
jgi:hypothetical protein